jgi:hypothetical protein
LDTSELLYCSDGVLATAIAKHTKQGWTLFGISEVHGFGNASFEKILFNTFFDDIMPFCTTTGVSYVAVKKAELWGLIRFRLNPEYAYDKEFFRKAIGSEPIDIKSMDPIGREIKLIENIKHKNINLIKSKYHLDDKNQMPSVPHNVDEKNCWSMELRNETYDIVYNGRCMDICHLKHWDGRYGTISTFTGVLKNIWNVKIIEVGGNETGEIETFNSVDDLITAGWVVD